MENKKINKIQKEFDLGVILNITTMRLFTNMEDVYEILNYLTGDNIYTHQIPRVMSIAKTYILSLYPELTGVGNTVEINSFDDAKVFINEQKKVFGNKLSLSPMEKTDGYSYVDPIKEAIDMTSRKINEKVLVLKPTKKQSNTK